MPILSAENLNIALHKLSIFLEQPSDQFRQFIQSAPNHNAWFTVEEVERSLAALQQMLQPEALKKWFENIHIAENPKKIGLILAGNIPLVGFHDVLSVLATGNTALIKVSSSDAQLIPALLRELVAIAPSLADSIVYVEQLKDFDAIIATGSNNTSRYFDYYFGKVPNIIRKNRNSVAVLDGKETEEEIVQLGHDIFDYFGLGCRNVSKLYLPEGYQIEKFFKPLEEQFKQVFNHFKYNNNYDYNKSIYLVNMVQHFDNGFVLLKEDKGLSSPLAVVFFEYYNDLNILNQSLAADKENIQCIVTHANITAETGTVKFGQSQSPTLFDYADNVDTIAFLNTLSAKQEAK